MRDKGLLAAEVRNGRAGYALEPAALPALARGDRRIYSPRAMIRLGPLVPDFVLDSRKASDSSGTSYGVGCRGSVAAPSRLRCGSARSTSRARWKTSSPISAYATSAVIFLADETRLNGGLERAVARWWDLPAIAARHQSVPVRVRICGGRRLDAPAGVRAPGSGASMPGGSFRTSTPDLPAAWLPADWPGNLSIPLFADLRERLEDLSGRYVQHVTV